MVTIQVLGKPSKKRLLLSWREPARCNYTEQLWALRTASSATTCALTGKKIQRGEHVYAPVGQPANHGQYICQGAVAVAVE
jgi:hypothetical protein